MNYLKAFPFLLFVFSLNCASSQQDTPDKILENIEKKTIFSNVLNEERVLYISHPVQITKDEKLPVIYILDGHFAGLINEAVKSSENNNLIKNHIVVGLDTYKNRNRDMIPVKMESKKGSGESGNFIKFLSEELKPFIDSSFSTNGTNIIFGGSNSGLFVMYNFLTQPNVFDGYISSSTMIGHCPDFMTNTLKEIQNKEAFKNKVLYVHYGMKDHYKQVTEYLPAYCDLLKNELGEFTTFKSKELKNEGHVPQGGIIDGLQFFYSMKNMD
jgi:predicted alpha/beta superfamily hydrolase